MRSANVALFWMVESDVAIFEENEILLLLSFRVLLRHRNLVSKEYLHLRRVSTLNIMFNFHTDAVQRVRSILALIDLSLIHI